MQKKTIAPIPALETGHFRAQLQIIAAQALDLTPNRKKEENREFPFLLLLL